MHGDTKRRDEERKRQVNERRNKGRRRNGGRKDIGLKKRQGGGTGELEGGTIEGRTGYGIKDER